MLDDRDVNRLMAKQKKRAILESQLAQIVMAAVAMICVVIIVVLVAVDISEHVMWSGL
jgi:hypothetical protein